ncbi:cell division protein FtsQ/DivIB [Chamaesiphon minutus]|uniref:Cell division septal protein n=1 Tax=Chamaesiphon minutus (strain ATCC 27169 / PCC 6605) TaxID=1173020 RepID=K9UBH2_CHAP6|nr:FtsQ-type POTRA domain-containing protein [Chamaesiphon minutus]AFY91574.1 cell division septal protein [Chamaesiphon minutus PCC 6605]
MVGFPDALRAATPNSQFPTPSPPVDRTVSREHLKQRRRQLQQQRRVRVIKSLWRLICMGGIFAGIAWAIDRPDWTISKPEQIQIEGNQYITDATVRSMLAIPYPKPIVELAPTQLAAQLKQRSSMTTVNIDRRVFPPRLVVQIQDFPPVARIMQNETTASQIFIDERGLQLPLASYRSIVWQSLPTLQLRPPSQGLCPQWPQLYRAVQTSAVAIGIVDCRNPQNLMLQTEVGKVRLGAIGNNLLLDRQIQELDRLRDWSKSAKPETIDYLDLENPDSPRLQLKSDSTTIPKPTTTPN